MRIANCKWFVGSRARWLHFKCCLTQLPSPYGSRVWQHGVSCLTFFSYMKNNFHLILLPAAENEWKKCFILKFVLVFSISTPTLGQWQGNGAGEGATFVAAVSLGCPWAGAGLWAKREGGRKGNLLGRVVSVSFCSMCVQIFMSIAFVLLLLLLMLVGTICQSPLLLFSSFSCCSPCYSHSFKHFMIFYLFSSSLSVVFCMRCVVENSENYAWLRSSPPRPQRDWAPFVCCCCCLLLWSASATPLCPTAPLSLDLFLALLCKSFSFVQSKISKPLCLCTL